MAAADSDRPQERPRKWNGPTLRLRVRFLWHKTQHKETPVDWKFFGGKLKGPFFPVSNKTLHNWNWPVLRHLSLAWFYWLFFLRRRYVAQFSTHSFARFWTNLVRFYPFPSAIGFLFVTRIDMTSGLNYKPSLFSFKFLFLDFFLGSACFTVQSHFTNFFSRASHLPTLPEHWGKWLRVYKFIFFLFMRSLFFFGRSFYLTIISSLSGRRRETEELLPSPRGFFFFYSVFFFSW